MVQTCWYLFGHVCDWCAEDTAVITQNTYKTIGMLVTQVYIWPLSAVLNALANKIKRNPPLTQTLPHTSGNKQKSRSSQAGYNTCLRRPLEQLRRTLLRQGTPVMVRRWTLGKQTLDPQTLLRLPACIAVFEEVEQERQVLGADPLTTVSDQLCWSLLGGQWQLRRTGREVYGIRVNVVDSNQVHSPLHEFIVS